jgi:hypothetical protein
MTTINIFTVQPPRAEFTTFYFICNLRMGNKASVFVPGRPFQPSLMFENKTGAYPIEAPFKCSTLRLTPGLTTNMRLEYERQPTTNTQAYWAHS